MLNEKIKEVILDDLRKLKIYELSNYSRDEKNHLILNFFHKNNFICNSDINPLLEKLVIEEAKRGYSILTKNLHSFQKYPDHLDYPECFAYTIQNKTFSDKDFKKIKFDHGETINLFVKDYFNPKLIDSLRDELLHPKKISGLGLRNL